MNRLSHRAESKETGAKGGEGSRLAERVRGPSQCWSSWWWFLRRSSLGRAIMAQPSLTVGASQASPQSSHPDQEEGVPRGSQTETSQNGTPGVTVV